MLHRPMWHADWRGVGEALVPPAGIDARPGIWISYVPAVAVEADVRALTVVRSHRCVAGEVPTGFDPTAPSSAVYCAGAMLLDPDDPARLLDRTAEPLLRPATADEKVGTVANVVFPTAIAAIGVRQFVFYGMADARIGVAELERTVA